MKIVSFVSAHRPGCGLVKDNWVIDLGRRLGERLPTLRAILAAGALSEAERTSCAASPDFPRDGLKLAPVIPDPDEIICIGLKYQDHVAETGRTVTPTLHAAGRRRRSGISCIGVLRNPVIAEVA